MRFSTAISAILLVSQCLKVYTDFFNLYTQFRIEASSALMLAECHKMSLSCVNNIEYIFNTQGL